MPKFSLSIKDLNDESYDGNVIQHDFAVKNLCLNY